MATPSTKSLTPAPNAEPKKEEDEEKSVEFVPFGATDSIRLTASMVRHFIAVPTKSGKMPSERDCIRFIMLCRGKRANPFEGDCFLVGYDSQDGPVFSLICGIELFLKRAEQSEDYDGRESGVIILDEDKKLQERPGALVLPGEKIVGGWARVYRKDRAHPEYKAVTFATYDTGRSRWAKDPGGQIEKVALSQCLRSAFPTALGALYTQEEMDRITEVGNTVSAREPIAMPRAKGAAALGPMEPAPGTLGGPLLDGSKGFKESASAAEKSAGPPPHVASDKWDELRIALSDASIKQEDFVDGMRTLFGAKVPKTAKIVADLGEELLEAVADEGIDTIVCRMETNLKRSIRR
jgi:phage recombination protein Bet